MPTDGRPPNPSARRTYINIRPSDEPVNFEDAVSAFGALLDLQRTRATTGLFNRLRRSAVDPIIEWLIVADGDDTTGIRYMVGANDRDLIEELDGILRTAFPDGYEFSTEVRNSPLLDDLLRGSNDTATAGSADEKTTPYVAGVEYRGRANRPRDWQTTLTPFESFTRRRGGPASPEVSRIPLARLIEVIDDARIPVVFQVVFAPYRDWTVEANGYIHDLEAGTATRTSRFWELVSPRDHRTLAAYRPSPDDAARIEAIDRRDPTNTAVLSARAAVLTTTAPTQANAVAHRLSTVLSGLGSRHHRIVGRVRTDDELHPGIGPPPGATVFDRIYHRIASPAAYSAPGDSLRRRPPESLGIVVDVTELPGFCVLDGARLTPGGRRALGARPRERAGLPLPTPAQLEHYSPPGMALGMPLTQDRQSSGGPLYLPPADQDRHIIVIGPTGSGKSVLTETAMLSNVAATKGPAILIDYKGGGTAEEYLRMHFDEHGSLDGVVYLDCTRVQPALSILDIRPLLEAGIPREEARSRIAGHYQAMLEGLMGSERFGQAVEAPKVIRNHLRALFDPVNGSDAVSHADLYASLRKTLQDDAPPPVSDERLTEYFTSLVDRDRDVFNKVLGGALNRVETIATDGRLAPVFDHVPDTGDTHFDFAEVIDDDVVVIFDFAGMEPRAKQALTLAILSTLWRALQARDQDPETPPDPPLVNCYLEETGAIANSSILDTLLSQGRSFGLSLFLGVQFLGQLDTANPGSRTEEEALNETATIIAGQVATRDELVHALATDAMPPDAVDRRLSRLPRGEWLIRPGTAFGAESVRPFLVESLPPQPGHPASDAPLDASENEAFEAAFETCRDETAARYGLTHPETVSREPAESERTSPAEPVRRLDTAYPHTKRMPPTVAYQDANHALHCRKCDNRYSPTITGMRDAIECHSSLAATDRDDIPIGPIHLKRSAEERAASDLTDREFMFLQVVHDAHAGHYDPLEYDLTRDSMLRLQEYVGIETDAVQTLIETGLLSKDGDHPHRLYTLTAEGRHVIGENVREGVDYGDGKGDLGESSLHRLGVILGARLFERTHVSNPDSPAVSVREYHDIGENQRLDVAALDAADAVVATLEVERINHDWRVAIPDDFDKMASCEPVEAVWITSSRSDAHSVIEALTDPPDNDPRIEKTYRSTTPPQDFNIDSPGLTAVYTIEYVRDTLLTE